MSDPLESMDPNLKEVLLDIAKDERSTLFRVEPRDIAVGVMDDVPSLSAGTAGWTPAERHLLQAYREEVALLLRNLLRVRLAEDDLGKLLFVTAPVSVTGSTARTLANRERMRLMLANHRSGDLEDPTRAFLSDSSSKKACASSIALAALSLENRDVTRILLGIAHLVEDRLTQADEVFRGVVSSPTRGDMHFYAWSNLGLTDSLMGHHKKALHAYSKAVALRPEDVDMVASCMLEAILIGDMVAARLAAVHLEEITDSDSNDVSDLCRLQASRKPSWRQEPSPLVDPSTLDPMGSVSRRIIHAAH